VRRHLAQLNIATLRQPIDHPATKDFADALGHVNGLGEQSPGFVWRLQSDGGDATDIQLFDDPMVIVNLTVWESLDALKAFAYRGTHRDFFRRRSEWFVDGRSRTALWWVDAGTLPSTHDATRRLRFIDVFGVSPYAFEMGQAPTPLVMRRVTMQRGAFAVAELDGQVLATAASHHDGAGTAVVDRIYVGPAARGQRVGAALVCELEAAATEAGQARLQLETRNAALLALFEAFGFSGTPTGEAVLLEKALAPTPAV
jgi:ribosomal protein S18 acetylase RimI-like enzyme